MPEPRDVIAEFLESQGASDAGVYDLADRIEWLLLEAGYSIGPADDFDKLDGRPSPLLPIVPFDDEWRQAVAEVRAHYPEDIFPPHSPSLDARSGTFARSLCDQIVQLADAIAANHARWLGPAHIDGLDRA